MGYEFWVGGYRFLVLCCGEFTSKPLTYNIQPVTDNSKHKTDKNGKKSIY